MKQAGQEDDPAEAPARLVISDDESADETDDEQASAVEAPAVPREDPKAADTIPVSQEDLPDSVTTAVTKLKNEGNTFFRASMYEDAIELYTAALELYQPHVGSEAVQLEAAKLLGNRAGT